MLKFTEFPFLHSNTSLEDIDKATMLRAPIPRGWEPKGAEDFRYEWDEKYIKNYNQKFSPWSFTKNCAAVLGHVRRHGKSELMREMAEALVCVLMPHIQGIGLNRYVRNSFEYHYLHHKMKSPFYGAFMNNVTAYGLLYLFEATGVERHLLLADRLLMTSVDPVSVIPLSSDNAEGDFWLHEYVFMTDEHGPWVQMQISKIWSQARIYNGHIHALLPLMRMRVMTGSCDYDQPIEKAVATMKKWLPRQVYEGRYFSYSPDMPIFPDYGQKRALHLMESLSLLTGDVDITAASTAAKETWASIEGNEKEIVASAMAVANRTYQSYKSER